MDGAAMDDVDETKIALLMDMVDQICNPHVRSSWKKGAFERLHFQSHPKEVSAETRHIFVQKSIERDLPKITVCLIELGQPALTYAACAFLTNFCGNSDIGSQAVLLVFDRIKDCFMRIFHSRGTERLMLLIPAVTLCANIVATCPSDHNQILPLVRSVFLPAMRDPDISDLLLGNTILLLASLSFTLSAELREMRVVDVLQDLVLDGAVSVTRKSFAESVIIFLLGDHECAEIDRLMAANVIEGYCLPIMAHALNGQMFRGTYPHLLYSSGLFEVLSRSRTYAQALVHQEMVVPLLLQASKRQDSQTQLESNGEGRRLALEALRSFARFKLWPASAEARQGLAQYLPPLLVDDHAGVRNSAAGLSALVDPRWTFLVLLLGHRLEDEGVVSPEIWRSNLVPFLFPLPDMDVTN